MKRKRINCFTLLVLLTLVLYIITEHLSGHQTFDDECFLSARNFSFLRKPSSKKLQLTFIGDSRIRQLYYSVIRWIVNGSDALEYHRIPKLRSNKYTTFNDGSIIVNYLASFHAEKVQSGAKRFALHHCGLSD